jgi:hypothetical protein
MRDQKIVVVVVQLFIGSQNRLVVLHSTLIKAHEETDLSPHSVIYRLVGSTMQLVTKLSSPKKRQAQKSLGHPTPQHTHTYIPGNGV